MKLRLILFLAISATFAGAADSRVKAELYRSAERMEMVRSPATAEICLLTVEDPTGGQDLRQQTYREGPYHVLPEASAVLLGDRLTDDRSFVWDTKVGCMPVYNARLRFRAAGHALTADFCFGCQVMRLAYDGKPYSGGSFDGADDVVFGIVREEFPRDALVRQLVEMREQRRETALQIAKAEALARRKKAK